MVAGSQPCRPTCVTCLGTTRSVRSTDESSRAWAAAGVAGPLIVNSVVEAQASAGVEGSDLYTVSMYIMVGLLAVGLLGNILMRPVAEKHTIEYDLKH